MARLGINLPVIEKVLNHSSGSFGGIVGVYQRHNFSDEKRHALERWGAHVADLVSGRRGRNVVKLSSLSISTPTSGPPLALATPGRALP